MTTVNRRHRLAALTAALAVGIAGTVAPVLAQEPPAPPDPAATSTTTTSAPPITILPGETTTTTIVEPPPPEDLGGHEELRSEEHTSELQSLMRISYAVFCLKKKKHNQISITQ